MFPCSLSEIVFIKFSIYELLWYSFLDFCPFETMCTGKSLDSLTFVFTFVIRKKINIEIRFIFVD